MYPRIIRAFPAILIVMLLSVSVAAQQQKTPPCSEPEARQFDFWVGDWEVHANGKVAGHNHISKIHGNCTLLEEYSAAESAYEGKSFNYYDPTDGLWHQVWVDNSGLRLSLSGSFGDGHMQLSGSRTNPKGEKVTDRITWTPSADGSVRQLWETSKDGGATWQVAFDGLYRPVE
jgi:hypothetical protein